MVDVFEEVDEELRKDRYQELFQSYGPWIIGAAVSIVAVTAGYQGWQYWTLTQREQASDAYIAAVEQIDAGRPASADIALEAVSASGTAGYVTLALFQRATLALEAGENENAAVLFDQAAQQSSDPLFRDLATLKSVWARWESLSFSDVEIRLSPLMADTAPYRHLARESVAAAALRAGELDRARSEYQLLQFGLDTPQGVARRAAEAVSLIAQREAIQAQQATSETETAADSEDAGDE